MKHCPAEVQGGRCAAPMQEVRYEGVTIDVCSYDDTVVLDRGELYKIAERLRGGSGGHGGERRSHSGHREHERHHASHHEHDDYHDRYGRRRHDRGGFLEDFFDGGGEDDD